MIVEVTNISQSLIIGQTIYQSDEVLQTLPHIKILL
jgi:hypothetical protein